MTVMRPVRIAGIPLLVMMLAACALTGGYRDPPRVSLASIRPLQITPLEQRYALQLRILNPNTVDLPVSGLDYSIEINRHEFAYGVSHQEVTIPAQGEALLDVEVISNLLDLMQQLQAQHGSDRQLLEYRLAGRVSVKGSPLRLPFEYSGELNWRSGADRN